MLKFQTRESSTRSRFFRRTTLKQAIERTRNETHKRRSGPCASRSRLMVAPIARFRGLKRKQRARAPAQYQPPALTQPPLLSSRPRVCMTIHYGFTPLNLPSTKMHPSIVYSFRRYRFFHPVTPRRPFLSVTRLPCGVSSRSQPRETAHCRILSALNRSFPFLE